MCNLTIFVDLTVYQSIFALSTRYAYHIYTYAAPQYVQIVNYFLWLSGSALFLLVIS